MISGNDDFVIHRILVAIDATLNSAGVLETAAQLARVFNAELNGIFVEDINLLRLAGLPFARELTRSTAMELHLDCQRMERALRGHAAHAQQAVVNITTRLKLQASLRIVRGQVTQELLRAAEGVDLFALGKGGKVRGARIGAIACQVAQQAHCSVLLVQQDAQCHNTVVTRFSGNERCERLLDAAARMARAMHKTLLVLIPASSPASFQELREYCRQRLGQNPLSVSYRNIFAESAYPNQQVLRDTSVGIVVIDAESNSIEFETQLAKMECSALLVR